MRGVQLAQIMAVAASLSPDVGFSSKQTPYTSTGQWRKPAPRMADVPSAEIAEWNKAVDAKKAASKLKG